MTLSSIQEILDFAIEKEEEASRFYTDLADRMDNRPMQDLFRGFAREEQGHKAKLIQVKEGERLLPARERVMDLHIADYIVERDVNAAGVTVQDLDYQDALVIAMNREKAAFRLYKDLAAASEDREVKELFLGLAQEEAKHKLYFEVEYDEHILTDN